ncbi:UbiH/UbiF/VisC/COQ6 family ubiquinone biosynthesis hydroxylase [Aliidiomarina maris]|uniref:2-octaprenylphenol hydroxylase n=1 Tax=Aliidiomarina maris TaxID=531312 RepID=A0A327WVC7_9GAMM|nr:UbiH/UbiF/VisC/COQ6 family ubiquinone biosynthesis hydroxylase [Aliidiomarina maris]RAJ95405.1 2-octaprenylphenol hydroxylase [Aliidiomarina maris]RUO22708.1 FAD-dependent 2-octaprenylphenol hydroxylase [Aliidiomarina maris]
MALLRTQIAIVGAGMVGLSLAIALAQRGREVIVIERQQAKREIPSAAQERVSALNGSSKHWLEALGVWELLPTSRLGPYTAMHVWDRDNGADIHFSAADAGVANLGHIVENAVVEACMWQRAEALGVQVVDGIEQVEPSYEANDTSLQLSNGDIVLAQLVVAADGARSRLRQAVGTPVVFKDYEQQGLVATIRCQQPHQQVARQAFMPGGPLALLPLHDPHLVSIVWSRPDLDANDLHAMSEDDFNHALTAASDNILGVLELASPRHNFPLRMRYAERWVHQRQVLVGDAAHTIHPLAGQGANLGIGDAKLLSEKINDLGTLNGQFDSEALTRALRQYERARKAAAVQQIATMEGFHQLFRGNNPLVKAVRGLGLKLVDKQPLLKQFFLQQANR